MQREGLLRSAGFAAPPASRSCGDRSRRAALSLPRPGARRADQAVSGHPRDRPSAGTLSFSPMATAPARRARQARESVVIRFAGDSGDGMQVTGSRFTVETALAGNDLTTFPDFPAEIRAPAGTTYGVSAFQIQF